MTLAVPEHVPLEQQQRIKQLMLDMQDVLPCAACGRHLKEHMEQMPIDDHLQERSSLIHWMVELHNAVNRNCGKREWSDDEVLA
eukprot:CAMPEP_0178447686 /NCGR_PEP_ID=MMETSP0689_2-20121128/41545_1 /TAXON_ID=160604 /ORGANISM="Amphidinium massartii, Strain CS-259" /LENGTH=83 /DNA_ID=CAMNT_0020072745 /DNA_START=362 /DNA_END=609 /DNA_ORIENTATION=+